MLGSRAYRHWPGNPQLTARVEEHIFQRVNAHAAKRGISRSDMIREIFLEWAQNGYNVLSPPGRDPVTSQPLPSRAMPRPDTGRSEPAAALQELDAQRMAAKETGPKHRD